MNPHRENLINTLFENMNSAKRSMQGHLQLGGKYSQLSPTQIELLATIRHLQPINFSLLAQKLHLTIGAISQLAEALEKHELLVREKDPDDRRIQRLRLSKHGEKQLLAIEKKRRDLMREIMEYLTDDELETWLRIQQKFISRINQNSKTE